MSSKQKSIGHYSRSRSIGHWFRAFWPIMLLVGVGGTFFFSAVVRSIESTQYPSLIYIIFAIFALTALLVAYALWRFGREERLAIRLQELSGQERAEQIRQLGWESDLHSVYDTVLDPDFSQGLLVLQQKIDSELYSAEEHLLSRLDLPQYLTNSLVGIGLVGTFIGLLSALGDFGQLLSGMQGSAGGDADPVAMFSGLMQRLQQPMEGMGTAFVSSLYGLLGSLVMGLVIQSVRKSGNQALMRVRDLLRSLGAQFGDEAEVSSVGSSANLERMLGTIQDGQQELSAGLERFADAVTQQSCLLEVLSKGVKVETGQIRQMDDAMRQMREAGQLLAAEQRRARRPVGIWVPVVAIVALLLLAGSLAASFMAVRTAEQLAAEVGALVTVMERQSREPVEPEVVPPPPPADSTYVVRQGDTLAGIALRHGVSVEKLLGMNPDITDRDRLRIGQEVTVPLSGAEP